MDIQVLAFGVVPAALQTISPAARGSAACHRNGSRSRMSRGSRRAVAWPWWCRGVSTTAGRAQWKRPASMRRRAAPMAAQGLTLSLMSMINRTSTRALCTLKSNRFPAHNIPASGISNW